MSNCLYIDCRPEHATMREDYLDYTGTVVHIPAGTDVEIIGATISTHDELQYVVRHDGNEYEVNAPQVDVWDYARRNAAVKA